MNPYVEARELTKELDLRIPARYRTRLLPELRGAAEAIRKAKADILRMQGESLLIDFEIEQLEKFIREGGRS